MQQFTTIVSIQTHGRGLIEVTHGIEVWVGGHDLRTGVLTLLCRHTSASIIIQENAAPEVGADLEAFLERIAPEDPSCYAYDDEGVDDMPAHIRTMLTGASLSIPLIEGRLALGTWQGIYLFEHRRSHRRREIALHLIGE